MERRRDFRALHGMKNHPLEVQQRIVFFDTHCIGTHQQRQQMETSATGKSTRGCIDDSRVIGCLARWEKLVRVHVLGFRIRGQIWYPEIDVQFGSSALWHRPLFEQD